MSWGNLEEYCNGLKRRQTCYWCLTQLVEENGERGDITCSISCSLCCVSLYNFLVCRDCTAQCNIYLGDKILKLLMCVGFHWCVLWNQGAEWISLSEYISYFIVRYSLFPAREWTASGNKLYFVMKSIFLRHFGLTYRFLILSDLFILKVLWRLKSRKC